MKTRVLSSVCKNIDRACNSLNINIEHLKVGIYMAELPEICNLSNQIDLTLKNKVIVETDVQQEKCLNLCKEEFIRKIINKKVLRAFNKGKWIFIELSEEYYLLLNLGMGGDILYYDSDQEYEREYQCKLIFNDTSEVTCKFWWMGRIELLKVDELSKHKATNEIAYTPFDEEFTLDYFKALFKNKRMRLKNLILDQRKIGGIGNAYIHDILYLSGLHPLTPANKLTSEQIEKLYYTIKSYLMEVYQKRGLYYERDLFGRRGGFKDTDFLVGYRENMPCPECTTPIQKIKTGSTSSFICPVCQISNL